MSMRSCPEGREVEAAWTVVAAVAGLAVHVENLRKAREP